MTHFDSTVSHRLFATFLASLLFALPVAGASLAADLAKAASDQRKQVTALVEAMPEESFDSKPTPAQRSFGDAVLHIAGANSFLTGFTGAETQGPGINAALYQTNFGLEAKSKEEVLAALAAGYDHLEAAIAEFGDTNMLEEVNGPPWVGKVTRASMFNYLLGHNFNIYGQLVVYLRLAGGTPPGSS